MYGSSSRMAAGGARAGDEGLDGYLDAIFEPAMMAAEQHHGMPMGGPQLDSRQLVHSIKGGDAPAPTVAQPTPVVMQQQPMMVGQQPMMMAQPTMMMQPAGSQPMFVQQSGGMLMQPQQQATMMMMPVQQPAQMVRGNCVHEQCMF